MGFNPGFHQPASNKVYSHPILAAKSVNSSNRFAVGGSSGDDHQAHDARPGCTQAVSGMADGGARSVTSVCRAISPADSPSTITRQGIVQGNEFLGSGPTLVTKPFVASSAKGNAI